MSAWLNAGLRAPTDELIVQIDSRLRAAFSLGARFKVLHSLSQGQPRLWKLMRGALSM